MNSARRAAAAWACWRWAWRSRAIETDSRPICAISKATCAASDRPGRWPRWAIRSAAARSAEPPAEPVTSRPRRSRAGGRSPSRLRQRVAGVALDQPARPGQHLRRRRCVPRLPRLPRPAARRRRRPAAEPGAGRHWWAAYPRPGRTRPASPLRWRATPPPPESPRAIATIVLRDGPGPAHRRRVRHRLALHRHQHPGCRDPGAANLCGVGTPWQGRGAVRPRWPGGAAARAGAGLVRPVVGVHCRVLPCVLRRAGVTGR